MGNQRVAYDGFRALGSPTRRRILEILAGEGEATVGRLCRAFRMSRPAVAKHLALLERARLVDGRWRGREHVYRLALEPLQGLSRWLEGLVAPAAGSEPSRSERVPASPSADSAGPRAGREPESASPAPTERDWQVW